MKTRLAPLILILCCAFAPQENGTLSKIRSEFQDYVDRHQTAGTVTLVAHKGKVVSLEAVGWQDIEAKTPMKPDSIFQIASMTKPVTALASPCWKRRAAVHRGSGGEASPRVPGPADHPEEGRRRDHAGKPSRPITVRTC
jgi:hypothetical protein